MKKVLTTMVAVAVVSIASADLTQWNVKGGVATDLGGANLVNLAGSAITLLGVTDEFAGPTINLAVLQGLNSVGGGAIAVGVAPPFLGGAYGAAGFTDTAAAEGTATFMIVNGVVADLAGIKVGDYVGIASATFEITDRWPDGQPTPDLPEEIVLGNVQTNIEVIPEPATFGLMGIAGLGLFLARKKARS